MLEAPERNHLRYLRGRRSEPNARHVNLTQFQPASGPLNFRLEGPHRVSKAQSSRHPPIPLLDDNIIRIDGANPTGTLMDSATTSHCSVRWEKESPAMTVEATTRAESLSARSVEFIDNVEQWVDERPTVTFGASTRDRGEKPPTKRR